MRKIKEVSNKIAIFEGTEVRKVSIDGEWYFSIEDIVKALTDSVDPKQYINKLRQRDEELSKGWVQIVHTLPIKTKGGKQSINCANTEGIFRIIQSIPSKKAEPFKKWLARVGKERLECFFIPHNIEIFYEKYFSSFQCKGFILRNKLSIIASPCRTPTP